MSESKEKLIDENKDGGQKDFKYSFTADKLDEAVKVFEIASQRLIEIHNWDKYASNLSTRFILTNKEGFEVRREPIVGDFIRIDIPGPGTIAGDGFDWVEIDEMIIETDLMSERSFGFRVKPSVNPNNPESGSALFLNAKASSSFIIRQEGKKVYAEIHGRNESPNLDASHLLDKVRNAGVAAGAILGIANIQWNLLAKGLLN